MLVLRDAGAGDTAGSTRAAAATWAMARGVNVSTIMQAADWTSARTIVSKQNICFTSLFGQYGHLSENSRYYNIPYCIVKVVKERQSQ